MEQNKEKKGVTIPLDYADNLMDNLDGVEINSIGKTDEEKQAVRDKIKKAFEDSGRFDAIEEVKNVVKDKNSPIANNDRSMLPKENRLDTLTNAGTLSNNIRTSSKVAKLFSDTNINEYTKNQYTKFFSNVLTKSETITEEEFVKDMIDYLTLCYKTKMIPTVSGLCTYLGVSEAFINLHKNNPDSKFYNYINNFYALMNDLMLLGAFDGTVPTNLYTFLSKNWMGYNSSENLVLSLSPLASRVEESDSIRVIEEQLKLEQSNK